MAKVFISAGHGGRDSGAVGNGFKEKDLNLSIALACRDYLEASGVYVKMSRTIDEDDDIDQEAAESNAYGPDLAVSIHNNAGGGDGIEAWYSITGTGKECAENILAEAVKIGQNSRGAKVRAGAYGRDYYGFIRMTHAPAVIVECAFIDNAEDIKIVDTEAERKAMGIAIAKGILKTLNIKPAGDVNPTVTPAKTVDEIAREVIQGKWGNGQTRKDNLTKAGYDYDEVQDRVDYILSKKPTAPKKTVDEIAKEVIQGKWGNGQVRKDRLTKAGYDYDEVQDKVDYILSKKPATPKKTVEELAKEVIQGKWGNGQARKDKLTKAGYNYDEVQDKVNELLAR